jgi:hypothetical protein
VNVTGPQVQYPLECPSCRAGAGFPYQASTEVGRVNLIRVAIRCRGCGHEWSHEMASQPAAGDQSNNDS